MTLDRGKWRALHRRQQHSKLTGDDILRMTARFALGDAIYLAMLVDCAPDLIEAARPKCEECNGAGKYTGSFTKRDGSISTTYTCGYCNGTGFAQ